MCAYRSARKVIEKSANVRLPFPIGVVLEGGEMCHVQGVEASQLTMSGRLHACVTRVGMVVKGRVASYPDASLHFPMLDRLYKHEKWTRV